MVNANGIVVETRDYDPFGGDIAHVGAFSVQHRFTGQPADDQAGGLYNYGARFYNARWGRFVSPDEVTQGFDSQGLNPYAYVENGPTSAVDPDGHDLDFGSGAISFGGFSSIGTTSFGASSGGVGATMPPYDGPLRGPWCDSTSCPAPPLNSSVALGGADAIPTIGNLPRIPPLPPLLPLLEGVAERVVASSPAVVFLTILLAPGIAHAPALYQAKAKEEPAKSSEERDKHLGGVKEARKRLKALEKELGNAKGPRRQQPIREAIRKLQQDIKGHIKEIGQKWPGTSVPD